MEIPSEQDRTYRFAPLERRGLLLGLGAAQLATLAAGAGTALVAMTMDRSGGGVVLAVAAAGAALVVTWWPVGGCPPVAWMPVVARWLVPNRRRVGLAPDPVAGSGGRSTGNGGGRWAAVSGITLAEAAERPGDDAVAVVCDRSTGARSAVLAVSGRSFALLDTADKRRRLSAWGGILAAAARPGSPVHRLQWVEVAAPGTVGELQRHLESHGRAEGPAAASYRHLITSAGPGSQHHVAFVVVSVHPRRVPRAWWRQGSGRRLIDDLLRREVRLVLGQLAAADLPGARVLDRSGLEGVLAAAYRPGPDGADACDPRPWPMAWQERWGVFRADGAVHCTYWVEAWPHLEVGPDFLSPLIASGGPRRVSMTMAPVDPLVAARRAGSARAADLADEELRRRAGFVPSVRRQREAEGVARRESELADGHAEYRYSGYVTVGAASLEELDQRCAEVVQAAQHAHLQLRRLWGRQQEAFSWTLPLGRGLA